MRYRTFPHAKAATVLSWTTGIISAICGVAAIVIGVLLIFAKALHKMDISVLGMKYKVNSDWIKIEIILIISAAILMLISKFGGRKLAEVTIRRKIKRSVKFAYNYCCEDPSYYRYAASLNREFAAKYGLDLRTLTIVERSRYRRR
ncbi:MAG: hypothetical protein IKO47_12490 [Ruminococcus sp.]|nr:hypothetical protein [Ruminococcus sp.]